jgi:IS5 family transposase
MVRVFSQVLRSLMARLIKRAVEEGVTKGRKLRVDTTVVEAPIRYPTDSRLCEDAVRVLRRTLKRLAAAGVQLPFELKRVGRAVSRRVQEISDTLRRRGEDTQEALKKPYRGLLRITARLIRQAEQACLCAREQLGTLKKGAREKALRQVEYLERMTPRARQVVKQTRARVFRGTIDSPKRSSVCLSPMPRSPDEASRTDRQNLGSMSRFRRQKVG